MNHNNFNFDKQFQIDNTEMDREYEMRVLELEQQAKDRGSYYQKIKEDLNRPLIPINNTEEIEEKTKYNKTLYLPNMYSNLFNRDIYDNELLGRCTLHIVLGSLLRDKQIKISYKRWLDYRIHLILIQLSSTGKGLSANFMTHIIKELKIPQFDKETGKILPKENWKKPEIKKSGIETKESFIDTYTFDKNNEPKRDKDGNKIVIKGSLSESDFFIFEESESLLNNSEKAKSMVNIFLLAMESIGSSNAEIDKKLTYYDKKLRTTSKTSFFFMTRPLGKIQKELVDSGLFQRCLFLPREIDLSSLIDMQKKALKNKLRYNPKDDSLREANDKVFNELIDMFNQVIEFAYNNEIDKNRNNSNEIDSFCVEKVEWIQNDIMSTLSNENVIISLLSMINRYNDNMIKLAYHSACMRFSTTVDLEDFNYAFEIIKDLYLEQKNWLSEQIEVDFKAKNEKLEFNKALKYAIATDKMGIKTVKTIAKEVSYRMDMEYNTVIKKINQLSQNENSPVVVKGDKLIVV